MSKELWEQQLEMWAAQDKINDLNSKRFDEISELLEHIALLVAPTIEGKTCGGKQCRCGKVAH
jgi:hypothetical protein